MAWQTDTLNDLVALVQHDPDVIALAAFGSSLQGEFMDQWSDVDVILVVAENAVPRFYDSVGWLEPLGNIYGAEKHIRGDSHRVVRVCFDDFRRVDVVVVTESHLLTALHENLSLDKGVQVVYSCSDAISDALVAPMEMQPVPPYTDERMAEDADRFWFRGVMAVHKVIRGDLLIALHLALEMVQDCCVLAMRLRDIHENTTYHRTGGLGNLFVLQHMETVSQPYTPSGILDMLEQCSLVFDTLAAICSPTYLPRRSPLMEMIEQVRHRYG